LHCSSSRTNSTRSSTPVASAASTTAAAATAAAAAVAANQPEEVRYRYVKSAKESIEEAFPEVFQVRHPAPKYVIKEERDYRVLKTIGIAALILGILFAFVKFGPTGDLSKTWSTDDVAKSTAYPR
jgi:hypothetical protein